MRIFNFKLPENYFNDIIPNFEYRESTPLVDMDKDIIIESLKWFVARPIGTMDSKNQKEKKNKAKRVLEDLLGFRINI